MVLVLYGIRPPPMKKTFFVFFLAYYIFHFTLRRTFPC